MTESAYALRDLKVLDLGTMVTAPLAAMLLGQLGADVIKVEHPSGGDPFRKTTGGAYSPNFIAYNQNKKSIQLDLTNTRDRERLLDLVGSSDILIENFRPGVMDKLGLTANALAKANPRLITCSITGFGADGPYCNRPAYDTVGIALSGILHLYLDPARPQIFGPTLADNVTGLFSFGGILAALHARHVTGKAQRVELNMLECAIALIPDAFAYQTQLGDQHGPLSRVASSQCFAWICADGRAITVHLSVQEKFWSRLVETLGVQSTVGEDPRFSTRKLRIANYPALAAELGEVIRAKTRLHWEKAFAAADIPFAPAHTISDVLNDPQVKHLGSFEEVAHPTQGKIVGIRNPVRINGVRTRVCPPPALGEHGASPAG